MKLRRGTVVVLGTALAAALVVGWLALRGPVGAPGAPEAAAPRWVGPMAEVPFALPPFDPGPIGSPVPPREDAAEELQVCGGAWVKVDAAGNAEGEPVSPAEVVAVRDRMVDRLRADADEYARAVAVWMGAGDEAALVELALDTHDPRVYSLAFQACQRPGGSGGPCSLLNAGQWARLDPGNAAPWLFVLQEAAATKNAAGVDEALFQISRSTRSERRLYGTVLPMVDAMPAGDASLLPGMTVVVQALNRSTATASDGLSSLSTACAGAALVDANRRESCARAAEVMTDHSDDLLARSIGASIGARATGSSARRTLLRAEISAWTEAQTVDAGADDSLGCAPVRRSLDRLREQALLGETGVVRRWVDRSGLTPEELLDRARASEAKVAAAAASAAAAEVDAPTAVSSVH